MPFLKPDQLEPQIRSGKLGTVYIFDGPETWLKERAVEKIIAKLLPAESRDFNLERFDGQDASGGAIVTAAQSLPFLGERRLVLVSSAEELSAADTRLVAESLADLPSTTCLIMIYLGKANLRDPLVAQTGSHGAVVTYWTPFPNQLPIWVQNEVRERGKTIAPDAAAELAEACGDLQQIVNELDKLCLFVGKKAKIELSDVRAHGLPDEMGDFRNLEEAIWSRDLREALSQGQLLSEMGSRAEAIFPIFERIFRLLLIAHHQKNRKGLGWEDIAAAAGARGKTQQTNLSNGMRAYSEAEARKNLGRVVQADYELKTGALPSHAALTLLILGVCERSGNRTVAAGFRR